MKIIELIIEELDKLTGVDAVALVAEPAIEADFYAFNQVDLEDSILFNVIKEAVLEQFVDRLPGESKDDYLGRCIPKLIGEGYDQDQAAAICYESLSLPTDSVESNKEYSKEEKLQENQAFTGEKQKMTFALQEDKQMVVGPLMIPQKLILRVDENQDPYYVYFSEYTIQKIAERVMETNQMHSLNLEHNSEDKVDGYMVSTWLVEDSAQDKQQVYGFNFPKGTWMGQYKIKDKNIWEKVKSGEIKGFSVEGFFNNRFVQATKTNI